VITLTQNDQYILVGKPGYKRVNLGNTLGLMGFGFDHFGMRKIKAKA